MKSIGGDADARAATGAFSGPARLRFSMMVNIDLRDAIRR
jgi:hypothetical protein